MDEENKRSLNRTWIDEIVLCKAYAGWWKWTLLK